MQMGTRYPHRQPSWRWKLIIVSLLDRFSEEWKEHVAPLSLTSVLAVDVRFSEDALIVR